MKISSRSESFNSGVTDKLAVWTECRGVLCPRGALTIAVSRDAGKPVEAINNPVTTRLAMLLACALSLPGQFLQPSPNGRYLVRSNGEPFLWIGDTAWYAGVKASKAEWTEYLEDRQRKGFTVVQISAGRTPPGWTGAMPFAAGGQPNDVYWDGILAKVREANRRGMVVMLVGLGRPTNEADIRHVSTPEYARYIAQRFAGVEAILSPNFDGAYSPVFDTVAENLVAAGTKLPITQHPNTLKGQNELYVPKSYLTFSGLQSGHHNGRLEAAYAAAREWPLTLWAMKPVRPVINIEGMYDGRGSDEGGAWRGKDVRRIGWISWLSGAMGYTYAAGETARKVPGTNGGVWGWNQDEAAFDFWRKAAAWPSAGSMKIMRDFFAGIEWWRLEPVHELIVQEGTPDSQTRAVFAASADRALAVAYAPSGGRFKLDLTSFPASLQAEWFDPVTGRRTPAVLREWLAPPAGTGDIVLLIRQAPR